MVSSGISMHRIAAPIVVVGGLLNVLTLLDQEWVIPDLAYRLTRSKSQVRYEAIRSFEQAASKFPDSVESRDGLATALAMRADLWSRIRDSPHSS